jgi:hypothetical protein
MSDGKTKPELIEIKIKLHKDHTDAYENVIRDDKNRIHPKEWKRFKEMIETLVDQAKKYASETSARDASNITLNRCHNAIMLGGERGSGKTTFMLSALDAIKEGRKGDDNETIFPLGLQPLPIIDPTLIEPKVHIFVNIIALIKDEVDKEAKPLNCSHKDSDRYDRYEKWRKSFSRLAEGMPCVQGIGSNGFTGDDWLDSEFVMEKGVRRAHAAHTLEKNFHDYIYQSLEFIKKTAFILCFDDIDTHFEKGGPVLGVIHKYLTTPQLIVVLSGDPQLYSLLIRQKQWKNFSKRMLDRDKRDYPSMVDHLEGQFFLKILKPERRIFLSSLFEKTRLKDEYKIYVTISGQENLLPDFYDENLQKKLKICGRSHLNLYRRFLLSLPIRTQYQLLTLFAEQSASGELESEKLEYAILQIFWSDLAGKKLAVSALHNAPQYTILNTLKYLVGNKILNQGHLLMPSFSQQTKNSAQFAMGIIVAAQLRNHPHMVFDYWIRVALVRELVARFGGNTDEQNKNISKHRVTGPSVEDIIEHCALYDDRSPRHVARMITAYMRALKGYEKNTQGTISRNGAWYGTLPLYGRAEKSKPKKYSSKGTPIDTLIEEVEKEDPLAAMVAALPLCGAVDHKGDSLPVYSFYSLLGVLGELVEVINETNSEERDNAVYEVLKKMPSSRSIPFPNGHQNSLQATRQLRGNPQKKI